MFSRTQIKVQWDDALIWLRCYITFSQSTNTKLLKCIIDLCLTDEIHNLPFSLEFVVVSYSAAFWTNYRSHASVCRSKNTVRLCVVRNKTTPTMCWMWLTYLHSTVTRNRVLCARDVCVRYCNKSLKQLGKHPLHVLTDAYVLVFSRYIPNSFVCGRFSLPSDIHRSIMYAYHR